MKIDVMKIIEKISQKGKQNIFILVGIVGIFLILISEMDFSSSKENKASEPYSNREYKLQTEKEITALLKEINGVGDVKVMITLESGEENIYAQKEKNINDYQNDKNENRNQEVSKNTFENEVVIVNNSGNNAALVEKVLQPTIQGVAVVCSGADDISVVSAVTNSVSVVLNVPTHKICVTKMR